MIGFVFALFYWIIALIFAVIFTSFANRYDIKGHDSIMAAVFWPLTLFYIIVIYPFEYINEKFSNKKSER